jgi:ABC-type uncharacterized transport system permease subunit
VIVVIVVIVDISVVVSVIVAVDTEYAVYNQIVDATCLCILSIILGHLIIDKYYIDKLPTEYLAKR